jgi:hypothetical protein
MSQPSTVAPRNLKSVPLQKWSKEQIHSQLARGVHLETRQGMRKIQDIMKPPSIPFMDMIR